MPTTAPARPTESLRALHLGVDTYPAEQVGGVGPTGREKPAAGVPATQSRRGEQPADESVAVAHRPQQ